MSVVELLGLVRAGHVNAEYGESVCVFDRDFDATNSVRFEVRHDNCRDSFLPYNCTPTTATSKCGCGGKAAVGDCSVRVVWVNRL